MTDLLGLLFFTLVLVVAIYAVRKLANPPVRSVQQFEQDVNKSASALGIMMNVLHNTLDASEPKAKEIKMQLKDGRYNKKKSDGRNIDEEPDLEAQ